LANMRADHLFCLLSVHHVSGTIHLLPGSKRLIILSKMKNSRINVRCFTVLSGNCAELQVMLFLLQRAL
jgi:hypothetical protein